MDLEAALSEVSYSERRVLARLDGEAAFSLQAGKMQIAIWLNAQKLGGLNRRNREWYVSKVFASKNELTSDLRKLGFKLCTKSQGHEWWALKGADAAEVYEHFTAIALERVSGERT